MPTVQLNDQVFKVVQQRAFDVGYSSVDAYVSDFLVATDDENIDHLFTPQRLAHIDKADVFSVHLQSTNQGCTGRSATFRFQ